MSNDSDKQRALCQSIALATRHEFGKDFDNLAAALDRTRVELAADLERTRAELVALRERLEASQLKKAKEAEKRATKALAKPQPPPQAPARASAEDSPTRADPEPAATPSNALLFFVKMLVDDVEGVRAETLEDLPDADAVRALAETATRIGDRAKLTALAEKWTGTGSELFPADWRALGRSAWKTLTKERQDTVRAAFKAERQP